MFGLGPATKIYVAVEAVDMRKGFEGLFGLVRDHLGAEPLSGHLFLFTNRSRDQTRFWIPIGLRNPSSTVGIRYTGKSYAYFDE